MHGKTSKVHLVAIIAFGVVFQPSAHATVELRGCGSNFEQQLALGDTIYTNDLTTIPGILDMTEACGGAMFSLALMSDGTVMAWGDNASGQLGLGDNEERGTPTAIPNLGGVEALACGTSHAVALLTNGTVMAWGENRYGQLGNGSQAWTNRPIPVPGLSNVLSIASGYGHVLAVLTNGRVKAWGQGTSGQLGLGHSHNTNRPTQIPALSNVAAAAAGAYHSLFLLTDGAGKSCGLNNDGQLGHNSARSTNSPAPVLNLAGACAGGGGLTHSAALLTNGTVMTWGGNEYGELGTGDHNRRYVATVITGLTHVTQMAVGHWHTLVLLSNSTVKAWGRNSHGQLGTGGAGLLDYDEPTLIQGFTNGQFVGCGVWHTLLGRTVVLDFVINDIQLNRELIAWGDAGVPLAQTDTRERPNRNARTSLPASAAWADVSDGLYADDSFTACVTVSNRGSTAGNAGTLALWANMATQAVCGTAGDTSCVIGALGAGQSTQVTFTGLSVGTTACTRVCRAFVDSECITTEDYDHNNQATAGYTVIDPRAQTFGAQAHTNAIVLYWSDPLFAGISNSTVMVRWSTNAYPGATGEGTLLYTGTNTTCTHSGLSGAQTRYYRFWVSQDGITWIDPPSGTNLAAAYPHLLPEQLFMRCNESFTSGAKEKTLARALVFGDDGSGVINTSDLPAAFNLATKWTIEGCGEFNPAQAGEEILLHDAQGTLCLLYLDRDADLWWDSYNTNAVCWTSFSLGSAYATNASEWSVDAIGDVNGDRMDEILLRSDTTFSEGGKTKTWIKVLFFDDNGSGTIATNQPADFKLATRWGIEGFGRFNTHAVNSSSNAQQLLIRHQTDGGFYLLYFDDNGDLYWNGADTNDLCWTSWTAGADFSTNATQWSVAAIGDVNGDRQDEILLRGNTSFVQGGKTKVNARVLFFTDNGSGRLRADQPAPFSLATLWSIEGMGNFNPTAVNSSITSEQLLIRQTNNATLYLLYFDDNGSLAWDSDTNSVYWTSYTLGSAYATNATSWSIQAIGDFTGAR